MRQLRIIAGIAASIFAASLVQAQPPVPAPPAVPPATLFEDARHALVKLGFRRRDVGAALARVPASSWSEPDAGALERVIRAALRELTGSSSRAGGRSPP